MTLAIAVRNPETGEVRVAFKLKSGAHVVTKLFRDDDEYFSVKFWFGDFKKTTQHWRTKEKVTDPLIIEEARKRILLAFDILQL